MKPFKKSGCKISKELPKDKKLCHLHFTDITCCHQKSQRIGLPNQLRKKKTGIICTIWFNKLLKLAREKKTLPLPILPALPKNIAPTPKPDKKEVIENQISRFGKLNK